MKDTTSTTAKTVRYLRARVPYIHRKFLATHEAVVQLHAAVLESS